MRWKIVYYNESVENAVLDLPDTLLARYARMTEIMRDYGPTIGMPHTKSLGKGLFSLRLKGKEGVARVFYGVVNGDEIIVLHVLIKKMQKIPNKDLKLARKRLSERVK